MKVSIITVCLNSEKTLNKCLESVFNQTYKNIELIVIDGGSSDNTVNIIKSFNNSNLIWQSEKDRGLYDAMNKGILKASGDLIGVLNSDDYFYSNSVIEDVVSFHQNNKIKASIGNIVQINVYGNVVRFYSSKNWNPNKLKIGFMPPHPSLFINKDLFKKFGLYDTNFKIGSDYDLFVRFFLVNDIKWKYSNIITTSMLIGGVSSSGFKSYKVITQEIMKSLAINKIKYFPFVIYTRFIWKLFDFLRVKTL